MASPGPIGLRSGSGRVSPISGGASAILGPGEVRPVEPRYDVVQPSGDGGQGTFGSGTFGSGTFGTPSSPLTLSPFGMWESPGGSSGDSDPVRLLDTSAPEVSLLTETPEDDAVVVLLPGDGA